MKDTSRIGREFELFIAHLMKIVDYQKKYGYEVEHKAKLDKYEIDVTLRKILVEMEFCGLKFADTHQVLIECKYWSTKVDRDTVIVLDGKVKRLPGSSGWIVSKSGFQSGAIEEAEKCGIRLIEANQLPSNMELFAMQINSESFAGSMDRGEPFWCLVHSDDGSLLSSICGITAENGFSYAPLFFAKTHAEQFLIDYRIGDSHVIGLKQENLRTFFW